MSPAKYESRNKVYQTIEKKMVPALEVRIRNKSYAIPGDQCVKLWVYGEGMGQRHDFSLAS